MSVAVTAPLSISQVLDKGFQLFMRSISRVWPLTFLAALLGAIPALLLAPHKTDGGATVGHPGAMFGAMAVSVLFSMTVYLGIVRLLNDIAEDRNQLSLSDAYFGGLRCLPAYLGASILFGGAVFLGCLLLLVPGIILMLSLSFYIFFIVLENAGPAECLKRSHKLVWGNWWRWAAIFTVSVVIFIGLYVMFGLLAGIAAHLMAGSDAKMAALIGQSVVQVIVTTVATPLLYAVQLIGFRDLQLRKGGDDLAARIAQAA